MRHSRHVVFAVALIVECYALSAAIPMSKTEDGSLEQEMLSSLLTEEAAEGMDPATLGGKSGAATTRVIVVADASLWGNLRALDRAGLLPYKQRAGESGLDRREAGQDPGFSVVRRDTMRCMVGRVYRPCWEI